MPLDPNINTSLAAARKGVQIHTGKEFTVSLAQKALINVIEMEDVLFRHDSAVLLPDAYDKSLEETFNVDQEKVTGLSAIRLIYLRVKEYPNETLLITGHTDTTGQASYNSRLSYKRAMSAVTLLMLQQEEWAKISHGQHKNEDIQQILTWINRRWSFFHCDPEGIDGIIGEKTTTATRNFQKNHNDVSPGKIAVDGVVGLETWGAFFDMYISGLCDLMQVNRDELKTYRDALKWVDDSRKGVGCGEFFPIEESDRDNYRSRINRRVEALFFDPNESPILACDCEGKSCDPMICGVNDKVFYIKKYLPPHPHPHAQSQPTFWMPEKPGNSNYIKIDGLSAYVAYFRYDGSLELIDSRMYNIFDGKLKDIEKGELASIDCDRDAYFYFSHRDDLFTAVNLGLWKNDRSGLPIVGPIRVPCGADAEIRIDIWSQNDWILIDSTHDMGMFDWNDRYVTGEVQRRVRTGELIWSIYGDPRRKLDQERWDRKPGVAYLKMVSPDPKKPLKVGTLSALPAGKAKIEFMMNTRQSEGEPLILNAVGSFNEVIRMDQNQILHDYHTYDRALVERLAALPDSDQPPSAIDEFVDPPVRCLLPGDICWHDQGQTNFCGIFAFAAAMNYWFPFTSNPWDQNGNWYERRTDGLLVPSGARTPAQIVRAATQFSMNGRDHDLEDIANSGDWQRTIKLLKLWIMAGVPVIVLVEEEYNVLSLHYKLVVGWDRDRIFFVNSGCDAEASQDYREDGIDYMTSPVGNDVDGIAGFYHKWSGAGGDFVDLLTTIDTCTFIPIYPQDPKFAADEVR